MIKKAGFYNPYLDTVGGGERYMFTLAEYLSNLGWQVDVFWQDIKIKETISDRLGINLAKVSFIPLAGNKLEKWQRQRNYDLLFYISDGSIPIMLGRRNILHFQVPFHQVNGKSAFNRFKLKMISRIVCNSFFTKSFIDKEYGVRSVVVYPPVDTSLIKAAKKENVILSVGRFSQLMQAKRQEILVETFQKLVDNGLQNWILVLVGGTDVGGEEYYNRLKKAANGYPIRLIKNARLTDLVKWYSIAKIFWYAAGYGIDEQNEPEKTEHFGITTVEAMAAGCIPVVVNKGGLKEIIEHGKNGYFWSSMTELMKLTEEIVEGRVDKEVISRNAIKTSQRFSKEVFYKAYRNLGKDFV